jgi:preprotein translocase subunit SecF
VDLRNKIMFVIKKKKIFMTISSVLVIGSFLLIGFLGLNLGIDFEGGSLTEVVYPEGVPDMSELELTLEESGFEGVILQPTEENGLFVKTSDLSEEQRIKLFEALSIGGTQIFEELSFTSIGPSVGKELQRKAAVALIIVGISIILFVAYVFRHVSKPVSSWKYGLIAVVTLLHDVILTTGVFALLSYFTGAELDTLFVVALLTVLGLSVNDTIVVFDRVRENLKEKISDNFSELVGISLNQTFTRSINTSLSTIIVLLALFFVGPDSTKVFALTLSFGMFFGTYSSIFLASPLLVIVEKWQKK